MNIRREGLHHVNEREGRVEVYRDGLGWQAENLNTILTLDADAAVLLDLSAAGEFGLDTQTANLVFAGPTTGAANEPTFRALVDADLPLHGAAEHDNRTRAITIPVRGYTSTTPEPSWPDSATNTVQLGFVVPSDYASGDLTIKLARRVGALSGTTAVMNRTTYRFRDATAFVTVESAVAMNFSPANTNTAVLSITIAAANFVAGDFIRIDIERLGADAADNLTQTVGFDGCSAEYSSDG